MAKIVYNFGLSECSRVDQACSKEKFLSDIFYHNVKQPRHNLIHSNVTCLIFCDIVLHVVLIVSDV